MKKQVFFIFCLVFLVSLSGCARLKRIIPFVSEPKEPSLAAAITPYSGPKAKVTLADFDIKTAKAANEVGVGLRQMLVNILKTSNRFLMVEPQALNPVSAAGGAPADLIIAITVVEFEPQASGGSAGVGGGGGVGSGSLGGLLNTGLNKAYIALDIRIIDAATSQLLASTRVRGQASDIAESFAVPMWEKGALSAGLLSYAHTPMEKAMRISVSETARYITENVKQGYYRY